MAAPVVAGDLALAECAWKLANPGKTLPKPAYWKKLLASTATDLGYPALDQSTGLVNAAAAVKAVLHRGKSMLVTVAADGRTPSLVVAQRGRGRQEEHLHHRQEHRQRRGDGPAQADRLRGRRRQDDHQDRHL